MGYLTAGVLLLCICGGTAAFFLRREKRQSRRILRMIDQALDGSFREIHLDESAASLAESSLWKYLCAHQGPHCHPESGFQPDSLQCADQCFHQQPL